MECGSRFPSGSVFEFRQGDILYGRNPEKCSTEKKKKHLETVLKKLGFLDEKTIDPIVAELCKNDLTEKSLRQNLSQPSLEFLEYAENDLKYNLALEPVDCQDKTDGTDLKIRRLCKSGIRKFIYDPNTKGRLHFVLDNIEFKQTFKKANRYGVTDSELRSLYRIWLLDPKAVDEKVILWNKGRPRTMSEHIKGLRELDSLSYYSTIGSYKPALRRTSTGFKPQYEELHSELLAFKNAHSEIKESNGSYYKRLFEAAEKECNQKVIDAIKVFGPKRFRKL